MIKYNHENSFNSFNLFYMILQIFVSWILHFCFCSSIILFLSIFLLIYFSTNLFKSSLLSLLTIVIIDNVKSSFDKRLFSVCYYPKEFSCKNSLINLLRVNIFSIKYFTSDSLFPLVDVVKLFIVSVCLWEDSGLFLPVEGLILLLLSLIC